MKPESQRRFAGAVTSSASDLEGVESLAQAREPRRGVAHLGRAFAQPRVQQVERREVAAEAEAADQAPGVGRGQRLAADLLACVDVAEVHLDDRRLEGGERVGERERGVRVGRGVEDHAVPVAMLLQHVDHLALGVGLGEGDIEAEFGGAAAAALL